MMSLFTNLKRIIFWYFALLIPNTIICALSVTSKIPQKLYDNNNKEHHHQRQKISCGADVLQDMVLEAAKYDVEESLDLNGILWMEHINLVVGSKELAEYFYIEFLGCTRDKGKSFHVNLGQQQFHLAENGEPAQKIAGSIGLTVPNLDTLRERIADAERVLSKTQFKIISSSLDESITLRCPWGNVFHIYSVQNDNLQSSKADSPRKMENLHALGGAYGAQRMAIRGNPGIRYIEVACPIGTSKNIAHFYREILKCSVYEITRTTKKSEASEAAIVCVGPGVHLLFVENDQLSEDDAKEMEGVHVCFYANDFRGLYKRLSDQNLIWTNPRFVHLDSCSTLEDAITSRTLRFKDIINIPTGEKILQLEHETRPLRHGQYMKAPFYVPR